MDEEQVQAQGPSDFEHWDIGTLRKVKENADIKADILRALNAGDVDAAADAFVRAGYYLLGLDDADESRRVEFGGTSTHGPQYWRTTQIPGIISGTAETANTIVYLDQVDRIWTRRDQNGKFRIGITGPPRANSERKWELVEQAYDVVYGENGDPEISLIPDKLLHPAEEMSEDESQPSSPESLPR